MLDLLQGFARNEYIRAYKEHIRVIAFLRHHDGMMHHTTIEDIRQIDRVPTARIGAFATIGINNMALKRRLEFTIKELRVFRSVVIEDANKDVT